MAGDPSETNPTNVDLLQRWQAHKVVRAGRIISVTRADEGGSFMLTVQGARMKDTPFIEVTGEECLRTKPEPGMWLAVYEDRYRSFLPDAAFVAGYEVYGQRLPFFLQDSPPTATVTITLGELNALLREAAETAAEGVRKALTK